MKQFDFSKLRDAAKAKGITDSSIGWMTTAQFNELKTLAADDKPALFLNVRLAETSTTIEPTVEGSTLYYVFSGGAIPAQTVVIRDYPSFVGVEDHGSATVGTSLHQSQMASLYDEDPEASGEVIEQLRRDVPVCLYFWTEESDTNGVRIGLYATTDADSATTWMWHQRSNSLQLALTLVSGSWIAEDDVYTQTLSVDNLSSSSAVIVSPDPDSIDTYVDNDVRCIAQDTNSLTFTAGTQPDSDIIVNAVILGVY